MPSGEFAERITPDFDPAGPVNGKRRDAGINHGMLPKLDYEVARVMLPGEKRERRVWAAAHEGGYLVMSLDQEERYGFLLSEHVTVVGTKGDVWDRMRRREPGLTP